MKKVGTLVLCAVAITAAVGWKVSPIQAFPEFKEEFDKKYIKDPPTTPDEIALSSGREIREVWCLPHRSGKG